jgi:hypothetical protein
MALIYLELGTISENIAIARTIEFLGDFLFLVKDLYGEILLTWILIMKSGLS